MGRNKGDLDKKPRKRSERALDNLRPNQSIPGLESASVRIYAVPSLVARFKTLDGAQRGIIVARGFASMEAGE